MRIYKLCFVLLVIMAALSVLIVTTNAADDENLTITEQIVTMNENGSIEISNMEVLNYAAMPSLQTYASSGNIDTSEYITELTYGQSSIQPYATTSDGRSASSDSRVGLLVCGFDTDDDGDADLYFSATASLQNYDIIISCAHVLWKPQYSELTRQGWATSVEFYAGKNGSSYKDYSSYSTMQISMNYINNTTYTVDQSGKINVQYYFNCDWSILKIHYNLGGKYGWFGLHGCSSQEQGMEIYTIGYPNDKYIAGNPYQWKSEGVFFEFSGNRVYHSAYTSGGNSGGPIINSGYVYAIATSIRNGNPNDCGATCMYDYLFSLIVTARNESTERWG